MPLALLNQRLAEHRQYLPIESAFAGATIGGIVATNDAGPLRHRFGTPRDLLIGVTLAITDGRLVKVHNGNSWTPSELVADLSAVPAPKH